MEVFLQHLINALKVGSIYAVIALGYTMVYGIIRLINFAHGEMMMFGAYFAFILATSTPLPFILVLLLSMVLTAGMGMLIEKIAYTPLRKAPRLSVLITAIGMSLFLQNLALRIFGSDPKRMPAVNIIKPRTFGNVTIDGITIITVGLSVFFMYSFIYLLKRQNLEKQCVPYLKIKKLLL